MLLNHRVRHELIGPLLRLFRPFLFLFASIWRRLLFRTRFIAITGSLGKTTTKEFLGNILNSRYSTFRTVRNQNAKTLVAVNLLRVRPWHRYAVFEVATDAPGQLIRAARLVRPHLAIITIIAPVHTYNYKDLDEIAAEKKTLLDALVAGGTAIVNGNDRRLDSVHTNSRYSVLRFGKSDTTGYDLNAYGTYARWPKRFRFNADNGLEKLSVQTQLVGSHWLPSVLASMLAAKECGISLRESADTIRRLKAFNARLEPVQLPSGAVVLRDEYNGSKVVYQQSLKVLREARANRKILIAADMADKRLKTKKRLQQLGSLAAEACDLAVFVGDHTRYARKSAERAGLSPEAIHEFMSQHQVSVFLNNELREGDLVLIKGRASDHMSRILFGLVGEVHCSRVVCSEKFLCDICWRLGTSKKDRSKLVPL